MPSKKEPKPNRWLPNPRLRRAVAAIGRGTTGTWEELQARLGCPWWSFQRLVLHGYFDACTGNPRAASPPWDRARTADRYRRTDLQPPSYKPKQSRQLAKDVFPWATEEHWLKLEQSAASALRRATEQLGGNVLDLAFLVPNPVRTISALRELRQLLAQQLGCVPPPPTKRQRYYNAERWKEDPQDQLLFGTPQGLHLLCCSLLVQPVFAGGKCTHFEAVDDTWALEEIKRLAGHTADPVETYLGGLRSGAIVRWEPGKEALSKSA